MRPWDRARLADLGERHPRLATAGWAIAGVLGALWILAVLAMLVGLVLGGPGPSGPAPTIDFDDEPATVLADATERLSHRDYVVEEWIRTVDHRTGDVTGGMFYRFHVESTRGQLRGRIQPARSYSEYGIVGDRPASEVFVAQGAAWVRLRDGAYWQRSAPAANLTRDVMGFRNASADRLAAADPTVVVDNETTYVVEMDLSGAPGADPGAFGTARYVVAKGDDPHLREIRYRPAGRTQTTTRVVRILDYGEATAPRPADVPSTTVAELRSRAARGLDRLL